MFSDALMNDNSHWHLTMWTFASKKRAPF